MKAVFGGLTALPVFFFVNVQYADAQYTYLDSLYERQVDEVTVVQSGIEAHTRIGTVKQADELVMKAIGGLQVSDALKFMSGAMVKDYGGVGGLKTVSVRGLASQHTAIVFDGVLVSDDQNGQIDLGRFSTSQAESIEMGSGLDNDMMKPASVVQSTSRISIVSRLPQLGKDERYRCESGASVGSFGTKDINARIGYRLCAGTAMWASAEYLTTDGDYPYLQKNGSISSIRKRENSEVERFSGNLALESQLKRGKLTAVVNYYDNSQNYPSNILYLAAGTKDRLESDIFSVQAVWKQNAGQRFTLETQFKFNDNSGKYFNRSKTDVAGSKHNTYDEKGIYGSQVVNFRLSERIQTVAAVDYRYSSMYGSQLVESDPGRNTVNSSIGAKYAGERLVVTGRMNNVWVTENLNSNSKALDYSKWSPSVGTNFLLWPSMGLHVRALYQQSVRMPSFSDLYFEQAGRRDLNPERVQSASAGLALSKQVGDNMTVDFYADSYSNHVWDRILAVPGKNTAVWKMENVGKVLVHGLETGITTNVEFGRFLTMSLQVSYTYQRCLDKSDDDPTLLNHQLPYIPEHSASALMIVGTRFVNFSYSYLFSGEYYCNRYNGPEYLMPGYSEHGVSLWRSFVLSSDFGLEVKGQAQNLYDKQYEIVKNYPMPGRQYSISVTVSFK